MGSSVYRTSKSAILAGLFALTVIMVGFQTVASAQESSTGTLMIIEDTVPDGEADFNFTIGGSGQYFFSLDDDSDNTLLNTRLLIDIPVGMYSITQASFEGYDEISILCNDVVSTNGTTAEVNLDAGEVITCIFGNASFSAPMPHITESPQVSPEATPTPTPETVTIVETPTPIPSPVATTLVSIPNPSPNPIAGVSYPPISNPQVAGATTALSENNPSLPEEILIRSVDKGDPDVYVINEWGFRRLLLNPVILSFHNYFRGYAAVRTISVEARDYFQYSGLYRNCEANDPKIYSLEITGEDQGILHWINMTAQQILQKDPIFFKKVFCVNDKEFRWYNIGSDITSLDQIQGYQR